MLTLDEVLHKAAELPAMPRVLALANDELSRDACDISRIAELLAEDQALATRVLRLANSAFYGMAGRVSTLSQAITLVGLPTTRSLVLAVAILGRFPIEGESRGLNIRHLWAHSIAVAAAAKIVAPRRGVHPETAFLAGILHDIGKAMLLWGYPGQVVDVARYVEDMDCTWGEGEQALLGIDHAIIGAEIAALWQFPREIQAAIRHHHTPQDDPSPLVDVVHVANAVAHGLDIGHSGTDFVPPICSGAWARVALEREKITALLPRVETFACSVISTLG